MSSKLDIKKTMRALDLRDKDFYDGLTEDEQKAMSPFLLTRYASSIQTDNPDLQHLHIQGVNDLLNNNFGLLSKHKKLFWLLMSLCGSGLIQFHPWIGDKKRGVGNSKNAKFITKHFPHLKEDEVALMNQLNTTKDLKEYAKTIGMDDKEIKKVLS